MTYRNYQNYIDHTLNRSPSRTTYSFARSQRFPDVYRDDAWNYIARDNYQRYLLNRSNNQDIKRSSNRQAEFYSKKQVNNYLQQSQKQKNRRFSPNSYNKLKKQQAMKSTAHLNHNITFSPEKYKKIKQNQKNKDKYSPSPFKNKKQQYNRSPNKKQSPHKSYNHQQCYDRAIRTATISGNYPTGKQISASGRYFISTIKNSVVPSLNTQQKRLKYLQKSTGDDLGPGYYNSFSQFGQPKKY